MITQKTANSVGGKTARPCESCLKKRASWFCPADDAFLCNTCDSLVHSANELAGRHKRVRLETASSKPNPNTAVPSWHQGFSKKARTPRNNKAKSSYVRQIVPVVPEINNNDDDNNEGFVEEEEEENEENDVVFNVPNFDHDDNNHDDGFNDVSLIGFDGDEWNNMHGFIPLENEFESLLEFKPELKPEPEPDIEVVKIEGEDDVGTSDHCIFDWSIDMENEMLNFDLNHGCSGGEEEEEHKVVVGPKEEENYEMNMNKRRKILLRLNYEEVINAWANMGCSSPWTNGQRPDFDLDHGAWPGPNCMGAASPIGFYQDEKEWIGLRGDVKVGNEEREARVSRYREKRRTRLFSKKIRYQVRKLNAEKRPRLKGGFVKRTI